MALKLILAATDLSERSDRAVARACLLARQDGATLHLLHVVDEELPAPIAEAEIASAQAALDGLITAGRDFHGIDARVEVTTGDPWKAIVQRANSLDADLIVMGSHRNRGLAGMFEGTTLDRVSRTSRRPVLRATAPAAEPYQRPVVGVDFSDCARRAAQLATELAPKAPLMLLHAYHIPYRALTMHTGHTGGLTKAEKDRIEAELAPQMDSFAAGLSAEGRDLRSLLAEGAPDHVLKELLAASRADLLCLGVHARSWLHESVLGSTAHEMLSECSCDLLLAPLPKG